MALRTISMSAFVSPPIAPVPEVVFYSASGHSVSLALQIGFPGALEHRCNVVAFLDDIKGGQSLEIESRPVVAWDAWLRDYSHLPCLFPIGRGELRRRMVQKVLEAGGHSVALYTSPGSLPPRVTAATGALILGPGGIGPNTTIGEYAQILPLHTIGHDVTIGPYVTVAPSCAISGYVVIEEAAFIGVNATILNGRVDKPLIIGAGATVAAGAVVTRSVPAGQTVAGNPARSLRDLVRHRAALR